VLNSGGDETESAR